MVKLTGWHKILVTQMFEYIPGVDSAVLIDSHMGKFWRDYYHKVSAFFFEAIVFLVDPNSYILVYSY